MISNFILYISPLTGLSSKRCKQIKCDNSYHINLFYELMITADNVTQMQIGREGDLEIHIFGVFML